MKNKNKTHHIAGDRLHRFQTCNESNEKETAIIIE